MHDFNADFQVGVILQRSRLNLRLTEYQSLLFSGLTVHREDVRKRLDSVFVGTINCNVIYILSCFVPQVLRQVDEDFVVSHVQISDFIQPVWDRC